MYDYGARFYDPQIGRFTTIDPLIEDHHDYTPYAYVYNNPISLIDPDGSDTIHIQEVTKVGHYQPYNYMFANSLDANPHI